MVLGVVMEKDNEIMGRYAGCGILTFMRMVAGCHSVYERTEAGIDCSCRRVYS